MELPSTIERTREISQVLEDEEFLCIRDLLLGQNRVKADVAKALLLARSSNHPSSVRLSKWFEHEENVTPRRAQDVLRQIEDPLALCLAALVVPENIDRGLLKCASDLGNGLAKAELATKASGMDRFALANESMKLGERDGFYHMFLCYARGEGVDPAPEKTLHFCSLAAYFGHVPAMTSFAIRLKDSDPKRWYWNGKGARLGDPYWLTSDLPKLARLSNPEIVFEAGRALRGAINKEEGTLFGLEKRELIKIATMAVAFYEAQKKAARFAVDTWTLVGRRNNVVKDIRILIAKLIWAERQLGVYVAGGVPMPSSDGENSE